MGTLLLGASTPVAKADIGSIHLVDANGLDYQLNDDVAYTTVTDDSGAFIEASYTQAVAADTQFGGTVQQQLDDAFDGFGSIAVSLDGLVTAPTTANPSWVFYNDNGPADARVQCGGREYAFLPQPVGPLMVSRRVFVPEQDSFARWLEIVENTSATPIQITLAYTGNLGSDSNTRIYSTSDNDALVEINDRWAVSYQNWSGNTSTDPRIVHAWGARSTYNTQVAAVQFTAGNDTPYWIWRINIEPHQKVALMHFISGQATMAASVAKATELADGTNALQFECLEPSMKRAVANFYLWGDEEGRMENGGGCSVVRRAGFDGFAWAGSAAALGLVLAHRARRRRSHV